MNASPTSGRIYLIVNYVEECKTAFAVAQLVLATGANLRKFGPHSEDDEVVLRKLVDFLPSFLTDEQLATLDERIRRL